MINVIQYYTTNIYVNHTVLYTEYLFHIFALLFLLLLENMYYTISVICTSETLQRFGNM